MNSREARRAVGSLSTAFLIMVLITAFSFKNGSVSFGWVCFVVCVILFAFVFGYSKLVDQLEDEEYQARLRRSQSRIR